MGRIFEDKSEPSRDYGAAQDVTDETRGAPMTPRQILPDRRESLTQKIRVGHRRTLYLSTQAASPPLELFVRARRTDCSAERVAERVGRR